LTLILVGLDVSGTVKVSNGIGVPFELRKSKVYVAFALGMVARPSAKLMIAIEDWVNMIDT
jgi:hypothetical protein